MPEPRMLAGHWIDVRERSNKSGDDARLVRLGDCGVGEAHRRDWHARGGPGPARYPVYSMSADLNSISSKVTSEEIWSVGMRPFTRETAVSCLFTDIRAEDDICAPSMSVGRVRLDLLWSDVLVKRLVH